MAAHLVPIAPGGPEKDVMESSTLSGIAIRKIAIKHCVLRYVEIRTSEISNTTLYQCKVYTSMISNSSFDNCIIFNSTINGCTATNSKVHECKFAKLKTNGCTVTTSPLAFRKFSPEIRETIFRDCVDFKDRKTPPLLIALRGDKELYQEAIQLFYKLNFFRLDDRIRERVSTMSANALSTISKLTIE
jgi:uncharacterized protein YjbI with pentapeptide repeats